MRYCSFDALDALPPSSQTLFGQAEERSVFLSRSWFELLVERGLEAGQSLYLASVMDGERMLALLPLIYREEDGYSAFTHRYSSLYAPLLADARRTDVIECLAAGLRASGVHRLTLGPHEADDPGMHAVQQQLSAQGYACHQGFRFLNHYLELDGETWEAYLAGRPTRLRNTLSRKRRKLEREQGLAVRLHTEIGDGQALEDYRRVYNASWKAREQYDALLAGLVERASARGWLRLGVLHAGGEPAAAQIWLVAGKRASIFRLAHDERWRQYSPGTLLTAFMMRRVIDEDRVVEVDFLTGNEGYKKDWMNGCRERRGTTCVLTALAARRRWNPLSLFSA